MKKYLFYTWLTIITIFYSAPSLGQLRMYNPIALPANNQVEDILSDKDIPTGEGGFARDYSVYLEKDDQVAIDLVSEDFDTIITLLAADGSTIAENDDGPDALEMAVEIALKPIRRVQRL